MHFQTVLADERTGIDGDAGLPRESVSRRLIHVESPERCFPGIGRSERHAPQRLAVVGSKKDDALDLALAARKQPVGGARYVTGIDMPGMGRDNGFGRQW